MSPFSISHHFTALTFLILFFKTQASDPLSSFAFTNFGKDPKFNSSVGLYGNARLVNGGSQVFLSGYGNSGSGKVMYKKPIKLVDGNARGFVSFQTYFAFSISLDDGNGLAFVLVPSGFQGEVFSNTSSGFSFGLKNREFKAIGVQFSASKDGCNVAINFGSYVPAKIINTSSVNMSLRSGGKLHAWIDYEASSRRLEVRLSQYGQSRPADPLLWHSIDFSNVQEDKEMFAGFSSVKGNNTTSQACFLYSWSFRARHFPHWMHSEPLDPKIVAKNAETPAVKSRSDCLSKVLAAMIFGAGCGALTAFVVLYFWTIFGNRRPVVPEEYVVQPVDFEYKKVNIVVDKTINDAKE